MDTARLDVLRGVTRHMATADNMETVLRSITTALVEHADATVAHIFLYLRDDECPVCSKAAASRQQVVDGPPALHLLAGAGVPFGVGEPVHRISWDVQAPSADLIRARTPLQTLENSERAHIRRALAAAGGHVHGALGAAELLGINPSTLRSRMQKLGISLKTVPS
jgi:DNA-binding NtrC family response regulator